MIELLNEQKTVVINQALTTGLNPELPMKPFGVEQLSYIPENWKVIQLKRSLKSYEYGISDSLAGGGIIKVLTMGDIQNGEVIVPEKGCIENAPEELILENRDLLFNRTNSLELVGKVGLYTGSKQDRVTFASYLVRLKPNDFASPTYLNYLLNSYLILSKARQIALPSINQANLNPSRYSQIHIPLPPIDEQIQIIAFIEKQSEHLNKAIAQAEKEIDLIQEYRTTLISDVITGKIDVRDTIEAGVPVIAGGV